MNSFTIRMFRTIEHFLCIFFEQSRSWRRLVTTRHCGVDPVHERVAGAAAAGLPAGAAEDAGVAPVGQIIALSLDSLYPSGFYNFNPSFIA